MRHRRGGDRDKNGHLWTVESLHDHLVSMIEANDDRYAVQFQAFKDSVEAAREASMAAVDKSDTANEKRFESVNEFRAALSDQQRTLLPRQEYSVQHGSMERRIADIEARVNDTLSQGKGSVTGYSAAISVVGLVLALGTIVLMALHFAKT